MKTYSELYNMGKDYLQMLSKVVLPTQILDYFSVVGVEQKAEDCNYSLNISNYPISKI